MVAKLHTALRRKIDEASDRLTACLNENGLRLDWRYLRVADSLEHCLVFPDDPFSVSCSGPAGYRLIFGTHIPVGQNPDRPDEVEVFCGLDEPVTVTPPYSDGFRIATRVMAGSWYMRHWSVSENGSDLGGIRRDILGQTDFRVATSVVPQDRVPLILARITKLYMKGA
ncbi:hypothetical protein IT087_00915 [Candidatus Uhrbacteria bacterium]|nr:hypothetical protein [Candidatus Uhrbacteria bacterium]